MSTQKIRPGQDEFDDPVLQMVGVGKELWAGETGNDFVARLRSEDPGELPLQKEATGPSADLPQSVWNHIEKNQGEVFHTRRGLPFTYIVEGSGIWFFRGGERINRKLTRSQVEEAVSRCPLRSTTEISDLMDYPYLFAILMDPRIRAQAW